MKPLHSQEQIEAMRKRLYDRGTVVQKAVRHQLSDTKIDVSRDWGATPPAAERRTDDLRQGMSVGDTTVVPPQPPPKPKRHYRRFVLIGSLLIFTITAALSSLYMLIGGNRISSDNIEISIQGQSLIGGGEVLPLQVAVTNQNTVPIESATLILRYPSGTRSVGDTPRNLFEERIPLNEIAPGAVQNIPVRVAVFGEENAEKQIAATVEYRVDGSNGMFYKDAAPLTFRISSSPLVLRVDSIEKVASGQLVDITLTAVSNASSPLEDILITASYPNGFDFERSEPAPVYGENVWRIEELLPEQTTTFKISGVVLGLTDETFRINFAAGPTDPNNQYLVGANLANARADFIIERPFIDVKVGINGRSDRSVILPEGQQATVNVEIINTLDETVYDMVVEVVPGGNALTETSITSSNGFYDSNTGTVRWEVANNPSFEQVLPGSQRTLQFSVGQGPERTTSAFDLVVNVYAKRVAESSAQETLIGTVRTEAKYSSIIELNSQVGRNTDQFVDSGPVPPRVGETTTYTLTIVAEAGANDITNAVVETGLPIYVNWLNAYDAEGEVTYNSVTKSLRWNAGQIAAGDRKQLSFQVAIKPSISQLETAPILLNTQQLRANDRFTGALLQDTARAVTTELSTELGFPRQNGEVIR